MNTTSEKHRFVGIVFHEEGRIVGTNEDFSALSGMVEDDLIGSPLSNVLEIHTLGGTGDIFGFVNSKSGRRIPVGVSQADSPERGINVYVVEEGNQLTSSIRELNGIFDTAVIGIALLKDRTIIRCNKRLGEIFGMKTNLWYPSEDYFKQIGEDIYACLEHKDEVVREVQFKRADGSLFWGRLAGKVLTPGEPHAGSVWLIEDLTAEKAIKDELLLIRKVFDSNPEAIVITDRGNKIIKVNPAFEMLTGYKEQEVVGKDPKILSAGKTDKEVYKEMWSGLNDLGQWAGELIDRRKNGEEYPKLVRINAVKDENATINYHIASFSDITERKQNEELIKFLAQHDALTGLPNRFMLETHLKQAILRAQRTKGKVGVLFIDLDNFKHINDSLGHLVGDELLKEVGNRLATTLRRSDIVGRIGGDEFVVVVMEDFDFPTDVETVGAKILDALSKSHIHDGHELRTSPSIGVSIFPDDGDDFVSIMKHADTAMYHAKSAGKNNMQFFAEHMNFASSLRRKLENKLHAALSGNEFQLFYQPQIHLATKELIGLEALIRWNNDELGFVSPASFIPLAEEIGIIAQIGDWVIDKACETARHWIDQGVEFGRIAVNISPRQFSQKGFPDRLKSIFDKYGLPKGCIELEITESTVMENAESSIEMFCRLRDYGFSLSIDDFGTGYSSLSYLKRFPIDRLKIDRSFVMDIETDSSDAAISSAVISLSHSLGMKVVAEGVETEGQAEFLKRDGCDFAQGYLYCRPVPEEEAKAFCRSHKLAKDD